MSYSTLLRYEAYKVERDLIGDKEYRPFVGR
jgi:CRISPR/Cas system-associated endonuclease Cas1